MTDVRLGSGVDAVAERATSTEVGQTGISVDDFTVNVFRGPAVTGQASSQTTFNPCTRTFHAPCSVSSHAVSRGDRECSTLHRDRGSSSLNHAQHRRSAVATRVSRGGLITRDAPTTTRMVQPQYNADAWFYSEQGQKDWVEAMELDTLTPDLPQLLIEMGIKYDPDKLAAQLSSRWPQVYGRAVRIAASLGGFVARVAQDYALGQLDARMADRAAELRRLLTGLGPSFAKVGQALSARPDLLPQVYLEALSELQDRLPSFPNEIAWAVMEEELGCPVSDVYAQLSEQPVAAASLGQVYKGVLRETGETVAVKVQRPGIGESIAVDMLLLRRLMGAVDKNLPQISQPLVPLVDEFAARLFAELDYVQEGKNAEKFQSLYGHMPRVRTPRIYWQATKRRVLTMEWIDGVKLTNKAAMDAAGLDIVDFVDVGIECTLRQLLEHGYFHADPHPGNLLAASDGALVYLDFGMMSEAPAYARFAIMAHVVHLVNRDYKAMCKDYYTLQFMDPSIDTSPIAPALQAFFDDVLDASVSELNFKAIVDGLGDVLFQFPFRVPAYYALILRSLTVLEGLALQADPQYKLLGRAYPYIARRLLTDPAPELRASFEELILKDGKLRWNRFDNLLREGSKSQDFDAGQLWLLAGWILSPNATAVRATLATELAKILDAAAAHDTRQRLARSFNGDLAARLVPVQPNEEEALRRGSMLASMLFSRVGSNSSSSDSLAVASSSVRSSEGLGLQEPLFQLPQGSGPFGLLMPGDVAGLVQGVQASLGATGPQLQAILRQPGATELLADVSRQLAQRFTARTIKFTFSLGTIQSASKAEAGAA